LDGLARVSAVAQDLVQRALVERATLTKGARLHRPGRRVVVLIGDGGLQFTLQVLAAAVEAQTPLIVLLWNNEGYGETKAYMAEKGIPQIGG
jgi:TPP-dependent 2-oxoacid decarboxylase